MSHDDEPRLQRWWDGLSDEERAELSPLRERDPMPSLPDAQMHRLTEALGGVGLPTGHWSGEELGPQTVNPRLASFLASKRRRS